MFEGRAIRGWQGRAGIGPLLDRLAVPVRAGFPALFRGAEFAALVLAGAASLTLAEGAAEPSALGIPLLAAMIFLLVAELRGLYRDPAGQARQLPIGGVLDAWLKSCIAMAVLALLAGPALSAPLDPLRFVADHGTAARIFLFAAPVSVLLARAAILHLGIASGAVQEARAPVLVFGTASASRILAQSLLAQQHGRFTVLGYLAGPDDASPPLPDSLPTFVLDEDFGRLLRSGHVEAVLLPFEFARSPHLEQAARLLAPFPVALKLAADSALEGIRTPTLDRDELHLVDLCAPPLAPRARLAKRAEDLLLAPLILLLVAPLLIVAALAVKLESPGPILFRQLRRGTNGKVFPVLKFRTMLVELSDQDGRVSATRGDRRVTRVGRILRLTSMDELPQLFNVLRGEMSLVGPRPHALDSRAGGLPFDRAVSMYLARYRVPPGITGWAQVNGWRGETDTREKLVRRVEHDLWYIRHWSVGLDLMILLRTVVATLRARNAY